MAVSHKTFEKVCTVLRGKFDEAWAAEGGGALLNGAIDADSMFAVIMGWLNENYLNEAIFPAPRLLMKSWEALARGDVKHAAALAAWRPARGDVRYVGAARRVGANLQAVWRGKSGRVDSPQLVSCLMACPQDTLRDPAALQGVVTRYFAAQNELLA